MEMSVPVTTLIRHPDGRTGFTPRRFAAFPLRAYSIQMLRPLRRPALEATLVFSCFAAACSPPVEPASAQVAKVAGGPELSQVPRFRAHTLRTYQAPEATQGVAVDAEHFYAIDNSVLAKYDIRKGQRVDGWDGRSHRLLRHLNSCIVLDGRLWCANSNYPETPMASSVEVFDPATLDHVESHSLGMTDEGSLTWVDRYRDGWIAGFAHYDERGGLAFKNHTFSSVVTFDSTWRRTGGWLFPATAMARMAPHASSGGAIGPDGFLYLLGHDRPEMYVVARPAMGPVLVHLATIDLEAEGQAFSWAQDGTRTVFAIDRRKRLVRAIEVPAVAAGNPTAARPFR
jgi:hypothetical protein